MASSGGRTRGQQPPSGRSRPRCEGNALAARAAFSIADLDVNRDVFAEGRLTTGPIAGLHRFVSASVRDAIRSVGGLLRRSSRVKWRPRRLRERWLPGCLSCACGRALSIMRVWPRGCSRRFSMTSFQRFFNVVLFAFPLAACTATALHPAARRVLVTRQPAPASCEYLGTVIGEQGGSLSGGLTSNKNLAAGAMNDMKNQAHKMGANYVVLEDSKAGNTISGSSGSVSGGQTDVTNIGNAYRCPPPPPPPQTTTTSASHL